MRIHTDRLDMLASRNGFRYEEHDGRAHLCNEDGDRLFELSPIFLQAVADLGEDEAEAILRTVHDAWQWAFTEGLRRGTLNGRREIVLTVHELLGIDRIETLLERR